MMMKMIMRSMMNSNSMDSQFFEILNKRSQFEEAVSYRRSFSLPDYESSIDSINYFLEHGHENNRFRKRYPEAKALAKEIANYYKNIQKRDLQTV